MSRLSVIALACAAIAVGACRSDPPPIPETPSALTPGGVKLHLEKGKTTQAEVMLAFGTPDLVTHKDGQEVWTYDRTAYDYERRTDYWTVIFAGQSGDRMRSASRSTVLIVFFDPRDIVVDYRLSAVRF